MIGLVPFRNPTALYGFAHFGKSLFWYASEILFAFFLTEFALLAPVRMGVVLAAGLFIAAIIDYLVGVTIKPLFLNVAMAARGQVIGAALCSAALVGIWAGAWLPLDLRFGHAILMGIIFRIAFALYDIPQNALMTLATTDTADRTRLAATRIWFSGLATLVIALAVAPLIASRDATLLLWLSLGFAVVGVTSAALLAKGLRRRGRGAPAAACPSLPVPVHGQVPPRLWLLVGLMFLTSLLTPLFSKLEPYVAAYALRSPFWGGAIIVSMACGILLAQPLWAVLCAKRSHALAMLIAALLQLLALCTFAATALNTPLAGALAAFLFGIGNGGVGMTLWAMFSERVSREAPTRVGVCYGIFGATTKLALALGGLGLAVALDLIDVRHGSADALVWLMAAAPCLGALAGGVISCILMVREPTRPSDLAASAAAR